jgi:hypothetical protein
VAVSKQSQKSEPRSHEKHEGKYIPYLRPSATSVDKIHPQISQMGADYRKNFVLSVTS